MTDDKKKFQAEWDKLLAPTPTKPTATATTEFDPIFEEAGREFDVDPNFLRAMTSQESRFKSNALSPKGASGLMQLMPETARDLGVKDIWNTKENIFGGAKYIRQQMDDFGGDLSLALAAYNAGPGAVRQHGNKVPPYKETQDYVKKILANYQGTGRLSTAAAQARVEDLFPNANGFVAAAAPATSSVEDLFPNVGGFDKAKSPALPPTNPTGAYTPTDPKASAIPQTPTDVGIPAFVPPATAQPVQPANPSIPNQRPVLQPKKGKAVAPPVVKAKAPVAVGSEPEVGSAEEDYGTIVDQGVYVRDHRKVGLRGEKSGNILKTITVDYTSDRKDRAYTARRAAEQMASDHDLSASEVTSLANRLAQHPRLSGASGAPLGDQYSISEEDIAAVKGSTTEYLNNRAIADTELNRGFQEISLENLFTADEADQIAASTNLSGTKYSWDELPLTGVAGDVQNTAAGLVASGGRVWGGLAGLYRTAQELWSQPFGDGTNRFINPVKPEDIKAYRGDDVYEYMKSVADQAQAPGQNLAKFGGTRAEIFQMAGGLPGDLSRIMLLSKLPGGIMTGMSADMATQAMGRGESIDKAGMEAAKGALLGSIARFAPSVGREVAEMTGSRLAGGASVLASTAAPTYATSRAFGADVKTALKETLYNTIFAMADAAPVLFGKKIRVKDTEGNQVAVEIKPDGTAAEIELPKDQPADVEVLDSKAAEGVKKYEDQRMEATRLMQEQRKRPIVERMEEAEFTVGDKGDSIAANPAAISVLNDLLIENQKSLGPDFEGFHGLAMADGTAIGAFTKWAETKLDAAQAAGNAGEMVTISNFIAKLKDAGTKTQGRAALFADYKELPEYTQGVRSEELTHLKNDTAGIQQVSATLEEVPGIKLLLGSLNEAYDKSTGPIRVDEAIAQSFRTDAEAHLGRSKQEIRRAQQELFRALEEVEDFDANAYAESLEGISRRGDVFARYARQKQRAELSRRSGGEDVAGRETTIDPDVRGVQEPQRPGTGDSPGFAGRDTGGEPQRGSVPETVRPEDRIEPDDFVVLREGPGATAQPYIVKRIEGDFAVLTDAFTIGEGAEVRHRLSDLDIYEKMRKTEEPPLWTEEVDIFEDKTVDSAAVLAEKEFVPFEEPKKLEPEPTKAGEEPAVDDTRWVSSDGGTPYAWTSHALAKQVVDKLRAEGIKAKAVRIGNEQAWYIEGAEDRYISQDAMRTDTEFEGAPTTAPTVKVNPEAVQRKNVEADGKIWKQGQVVDPTPENTAFVVAEAEAYNKQTDEIITEVKRAPGSPHAGVGGLHHGALEQIFGSDHRYAGVPREQIIRLLENRKQSNSQYIQDIQEAHNAWKQVNQIEEPAASVQGTPEVQVETSKQPLTEARRTYLTNILEGKDPKITTQTIGGKEVKFLSNSKAKIILQPDDVPYVEQKLGGDIQDPFKDASFAKAFKDARIFDAKVKQEVKDFASEEFPHLFSLLGRKSTGKPLVTNPNAAAGERIQAARGMEAEGRLSGIANQLVQLYQSFKRQFKEIDPNESIQMARAADSFRLMSNLNNWAKLQATNDVARITEGLTREQYDIFENVLILRDKQQAVEKGMKPGHGYADLADVETSLKEYEKAAMADPAIAKALGERETMRRATVQGLVDIGMLGEEALDNTRYFHRQVPQEAESNLFLSLGNRDLRVRKKGFEKKRTGEGDDYNTNYVESEIEWVSQAHAQIRKQELLREIERAVDISNDLKVEAKITGVDWHSLVPSDHRIWQPKEGSYFYQAMTVPDQMLAGHMASGYLPSMPMSDLQPALAKGQRKPEWVLPKGVAKLMDEFSTRVDDLPHANLYSNAQATWKQWMLINPKNYLSYNLRNFISDLDAAMAYPGMIGELPAAIKDIYGYSRSKNHPSAAEIEQAIKDGVMDSGQTFAEIPDISKLGAFKMFADTDQNILSRGLNKVWDAMKGTTNARENWIRLAAYRHLKKKIEAGEAVYGASTPGQVEALTPGRQAAKVARELVGDYGGISEAGRAIRKHMIPFYSWLEINAPRYVRLIKNIPAEAKANSKSAGPRLAGRVAFNGVKMGAQLAALTAGINVWNHVMFPDLEEDLKKTDIGKRPHLIVGRNPDGSARVFQADTALRDAMDWLNLGDAVSDVYQLRTGQATVTDKLAEAVKAPVDRVVTGLGPFKTAGELIVGRSTFPSIFEKGDSFRLQTRPIRDRAEHLAQAFAVKGIYQKVMGRPAPPASGPIGQLSDWFLTMRVDPKESIFWHVKSKVQEYKKKIGKASPGSDPTEKSNTLFYYKQALRWNNPMAAERYLKQYKEEFGGTNAGLRASLKKTHPLGSLAKKDWDDFEKTLTPEEKEMLQIAVEYFEGEIKK